MFEAATQGFKPGAAAPVASAPAAAPAGGKDAEMAALKAELAALKDKIEKLGNRSNPPSTGRGTAAKRWWRGRAANGDL